MRLFISHTDTRQAAELERVLRRASGNSVEIFNSSRAASGIAAGQPIDMALLSSIRESNAVVWMVSPESVNHSFWMAWELGVADAFEKPVLPCRILGIAARELPLLQDRRLAPDLGDRDDLASFVATVCQALRVDQDMTAEAVAELYKRHPDATPFDALAEEALDIVIAGQRLLVENKTSHQMTNLVLRTEDNDLQEVLSRIDYLDKHGRRITKSPSGATDDLRVFARWSSSSNGRRWQSLTVRTHT